MNTHALPLSPSDYLAGTVGLSCCEHGVHILLLVNSWQRGPLPDDHNRLAAMTANPPIETLRYVLDEFWVLGEDGWFNDRLEAEREKLTERQARRSAAGKKAIEARWGKRADSTRIECESNANRIPPCPHQKIIELYHKHCPHNPRIRSWEGQRPKYLQARWRSHPDLEWWNGFLEYVSECEFLTGRKEGSRGPFRPGLDWMVRPENFQKINEGHYS